MIGFLDGPGYEEDGELDNSILTKRLERKSFCIQTLRTFYPYVLNERKRKSGNFASYGSLSFPIKKHGKQDSRYSNGRKHRHLETTH